jgi:hypothetical protein
MALHRIRVRGRVRQALFCAKLPGLNPTWNCAGLSPTAEFLAAGALFSIAPHLVIAAES